MKERDELISHLRRVLHLVAREDEHLLAVRERLFGNTVGAVDGAWVNRLVQDPIGIDRLESFVGKFTRMQDTIMDKLVPRFLRFVGEPVGTAIDNLNRMERLGFIESADDWIELRYLRNRLVHEYMENAEEMADALNRARRQTDAMHRAYLRVRDKLGL